MAALIHCASAPMITCPLAPALDAMRCVCISLLALRFIRDRADGERSGGGRGAAEATEVLLMLCAPPGHSLCNLRPKTGDGPRLARRTPRQKQRTPIGGDASVSSFSEQHDTRKIMHD